MNVHEARQLRRRDRLAPAQVPPSQARGVHALFGPLDHDLLVLGTKRQPAHRRRPRHLERVHDLVRLDVSDHDLVALERSQRHVPSRGRQDQLDLPRLRELVGVLQDAVLGVPDIDRRRRVRGHQVRPVAGEHGGERERLVRREGVLGRERRRVHQRHRVMAVGEQTLLPGERHEASARDRLPLGPGGHIPEPRRVVERRGRERLALGTKRQARDGLVVPGERLLDLLSRDVPQDHAFALLSAQAHRQRLRVWGQRDRHDLVVFLLIGP